MRRFGLVRMLLAGSTAVLTVGCTINFVQPAPAEAPSPPATIGIVTSTATASSSAHSPSPRPATSSPSAPAPQAPMHKSIDTLDKYSEFVSPFGRIACAIMADRAWCTFPEGMDRSRLPSAEKACAPDSGPVGSVEVSPTGVNFHCGDVGAIGAPRGRDETRWADGYEGPGLVNGSVMLPYGWNLISSTVACNSAENGVTCVHASAGEGFRVARAGVTVVRP